MDCLVFFCLFSLDWLGRGLEGGSWNRGQRKAILRQYRPLAAGSWPIMRLQAAQLVHNIMLELHKRQGSIQGA
ncbi:hypothetical protein F4823DRAFT_609124 [Ustulina deusta]|nr:hypothetical protein F4823DRAFT_609124 [Ustulina deusta]